jgi:hypothetical protein
VIGRKKLSTIRDELQMGLAPDGGDPIQWLEQSIASAKRKGDRVEVLEGLERFLKSPPEHKRRQRRVGAKK